MNMYHISIDSFASINHVMRTSSIRFDKSDFCFKWTIAFSQWTFEWIAAIHWNVRLNMWILFFPSCCPTGDILSRFGRRLYYRSNNALADFSRFFLHLCCFFHSCCFCILKNNKYSRAEKKWEENYAGRKWLIWNMWRWETSIEWRN